MAATINADTEVSKVNKKVKECTCAYSCTHIAIPREWARMTRRDVEAVIDSWHEFSSFCTVCLTPYSGIPTTEEIILRCLRCRHMEIRKRNAVKEGENRWLYTGDIVSNRFNRILDFEKEVRKINLDDPYNVDDDYKRLHETHASVLKALSNINTGVRAQVDSHRMSHNMAVYRERQQLREQLDNDNTQGRRRKKRERIQACLVEMSGSLTKNNFVLDPKSFIIPENVVFMVKRQGYDEVVNVDKLLLDIGLPNTFIKQHMPLYHSRLRRYRKYIKCTYVVGRGDKECDTCKNCDTKLYTISDEDILREDDERNNDSTKENKTEIRNVLQTTTEENNNMLSESVSGLEDVQPKKRKKHRLRKTLWNCGDELVNEHTRSEDDLLTMLECLSTNRDYSQEIEELIVTVAESGEMAVAHYSAQKVKDHDLDFRFHLGVTNHGNDYDEQKFILRHFHKMKPDRIDRYDIDYLNRVCLEVVDQFKVRKDMALEERRVRIIDYLEETAKKMCARVDDVKNDILRQLKMTYQRKVIRNRELNRRQDIALEQCLIKGTLSIDSTEEEIQVVLAEEKLKMDMLLFLPHPRNAAMYADQEDEKDKGTKSLASSPNKKETDNISSVSTTDDKQKKK